MRAFHQYFAWVVVASNLAVGAWGSWRHRKHLPSTRAFWTALGVAWSTIYIQGLAGLTLFHTHKPPFKHHFYGFLFVVITIAVWPLRSEPDRRRLLAFSVATLFIGIVAVRAAFSCSGCG